MPDDLHISDQSLRWNYWFLTNRAQLTRAFIIFLIVFDSALFAYAAFRLGVFLFVEEPKTQAALVMLPKNYLNIRDHGRYIANDLIVQEVESFVTHDGRVDFYARIENPNKQYAATSFSYRFLYDEGQTPLQTGYALPGAMMDVSLLGVSDVRFPSNPQFVITDVVWKRQVNWEKEKLQKFNITIADSTIEPFVEGSRSGRTIAFTVVNDSVYNFWSVQVPVVLLRGDRVLGVNALRLEKLQAGEHRPVTLQWFNAPSGAVTLRITPHVNVLDPSVFQKVRAE